MRMLLLGAALAATVPAFAANEPAKGAAKESRAGRVAFLRCAACHALHSDAPHKVGPNLNAVVGSRAGQAHGFAYSEAMKRAAPGLVWDHATLRRWIENPSSVVPGTSMAYANTLGAADVDALIAWLETPPR